MKICVDTVIFLDILKDEHQQTQERFYQAIDNGESLITTVITVAELMPQFNCNKKLVLTFLNDHRIKIMDIDIESTILGSERWVKYIKRKKKRRCPSCKAIIPGRDKILADFLIGGFALTHCDCVFTRDRGIYKTYFNDLIKY